MSISPTLLIYALIFGGILLLVEALYLLTFGRSARLGSRLNRRLEMLESGGKRTEVIDRLRKETTQHGRGAAIPFYSLLAEKAEKGKIAFSPLMLILVMGLLGCAAFVAMSMFTAAPTALKIGVSSAMGVASVWMW
ncbi:MAG: pilus assembly protein TadB, partial [Pararhodobacter sp.]|nr:pilus assembly protein TadB [Pararhodobacter sp.]